MPDLSRRALLSTSVLLAAPRWARADPLPAPRSVISVPPRVWGSSVQTETLPDPDVLVLDRRFEPLLIGACIRLAHHGEGWYEGPAWSNEGRFLLLSNTVTSQQYRYVPDDGPNGHMSVFRAESFGANGNTIDAQGRIVTCEHGLRRVIRWEQDGSCRVLADRFQGQGLNSPNDVVEGPDGAIWFTDPGYGDDEGEGHADAPGGPANPTGALRPAIGQEVEVQFGAMRRQTDHTFRVDPKTGLVEAVLSQDDVPGPNGLCFSPDGRTLYVISSGPAPGQTGRSPDHCIRAFDMRSGRPRDGRIFTPFTLDGQSMRPDGMRADVFGNLWCGASGPLGLAGVFVYAPDGTLIGRLRLPSGCSNLTFGGPKRNVLFACAGPQIFSFVTNTQGAGTS